MPGGLKPLRTDEQTNMAASYVLGYRLAIWGAGLSYIVAGLFNWNIAYLFMASVMALNGCVVFFIQEPAREIRKRTANAKEANAGKYCPALFRLCRAAGSLDTDRVSSGRNLSDIRQDNGANGQAHVSGNRLYRIQVVLSRHSLVLGPSSSGGLSPAPISLRLGLMRCLLIGSALMVVTNAAFAWLSTVSEPKDCLSVRNGRGRQSCGWFRCDDLYCLSVVSFAI